MQVLGGGKLAVAGPKADLAGRTKEKKESAKARARKFVRPQLAFAQASFQADVTPRLLAAGPAFGDVLRSIGHAVAVTQTALDETALESLKTLAAQQVDVPVLLIQTLKPDGTPDDDVTIQTASMPLTSIITPSMQQVDQMTLRMDMRVQSFDATSGIKFNQNMASAGVSYSNHSFGFAVAVNNVNVNAQFSNMSDFSSGSVMMSMDIVDRTGFQIPTPLQYGTGASLIVGLTGIVQTVTQDIAQRVATLKLRVIESTGAVDKFTPDDVGVPPGLQPGTQTPGELTITRTCAPADPYLERKVYVTLGQLTKEATFYI